jgi:hypothetical protein
MYPSVDTEKLKGLYWRSARETPDFYCITGRINSGYGFFDKIAYMGWGRKPLNHYVSTTLIYGHTIITRVSDGAYLLVEQQMNSFMVLGVAKIIRAYVGIHGYTFEVQPIADNRMASYYGIEPTPENFFAASRNCHIRSGSYPLPPDLRHIEQQADDYEEICGIACQAYGVEI